MRGRRPLPTNLLEINGTAQKNPKRLEARKGEPTPTGVLGPPPSRWRVHPKAKKAAALFDEGKSTPEVAALLGIDWDVATSLRNVKALADNATLRRLWAEVAEMAPWLTSADRWTVESICELKLQERKGAIKSGDRAELGRLAGKCGLNPSDRSRVNVTPAGGRSVHAEDPRDQYMRRKAQAG